MCMAYMPIFHYTGPKRNKKKNKMMYIIEGKKGKFSPIETVVNLLPVIRVVML